jgi:hypothetical protein
MMGYYKTLAAAIAVLLSAQSMAHGQQSAISRATSSGQFHQSAQFAQKQNSRLNPALRYFGGKNAQTVYQQPPARQQLPAPQPVQVTRASKPFSGMVTNSTITPYLNLDVRQSDVGIPNYYAFVRPQLEQQRTNQLQSRQMQRMQRDLRMASVPGIASPNGGIPTTGHSTQFLNIGNYFPGK